MGEIKSAIAHNITELRQAKNWTQMDLAKELNYSDKAVSKWERGESVPSVAVLVEIAKLFDVSLDYLVAEEHDNPAPETQQEKKVKNQNRSFITAMSVLLVWLVAMIIFVVIQLAAKDVAIHWLAYVYALPISAVVWLVMNTIWFNQRLNYLIISIIMWTALIAIHLTFLVFSYNIWLIYTLGLPGQVLIILWSRLRYKNS